MSTFGENVRRLRETRGYATQRAFAKALGVEQSRLSDWENDRYGLPEMANILKIAKTLGVSVEALLVGVDAEYDAVQKRETGVALVSTDGVQGSLSHHPDQGGIHGSPVDRLAELEQALTVESLEFTTAFIERIRELFAAVGQPTDPTARRHAVPGAADQARGDRRDRAVRGDHSPKARPALRPAVVKPHEKEKRRA